MFLCIKISKIHIQYIDTRQTLDPFMFLSLKIHVVALATRCILEILIYALVSDS